MREAGRHRPLYFRGTVRVQRNWGQRALSNSRAPAPVPHYGLPAPAAAHAATPCFAACRLRSTHVASHMQVIVGFIFL
jgi:hypothetical protein